MLLADLVIAQPRAGDEAGTSHARGAGGMRVLGVAPLDGIELGPQHLGLEPQCRDRSLLLLTRPAARDRQPERVVRITRRLHQSRAEVLEPRRVDPSVVAFECRKAHADGRRPKQFGERRGDRLDPRPPAGEVHIGVDRVAHRGQDAAL